MWIKVVSLKIYIYYTASWFKFKHFKVYVLASSIFKSLKHMWESYTKDLLRIKRLRMNEIAVSVQRILKWTF